MKKDVLTTPKNVIVDPKDIRLDMDHPSAREEMVQKRERAPASVDYIEGELGKKIKGRNEKGTIVRLLKSMTKGLFRFFLPYALVYVGIASICLIFNSVGGGITPASLSFSLVKAPMTITFVLFCFYLLSFLSDGSEDPDETLREWWIIKTFMDSQGK